MATTGIELRLARPAQGSDGLCRISSAEVARFLHAVGRVLDHEARPPQIPSWPTAEAASWHEHRQLESLEVFELEMRGYPSPFPPLTDQERSTIVAYKQRLHEALHVAPERNGTVARFKLESQSQYFLSEGECASLLDALSANPDADAKWVTYLGYAAKNGGCYVR